MKKSAPKKRKKAPSRSQEKKTPLPPLEGSDRRSALLRRKAEKTLKQQVERLGGFSARDKNYLIQELGTHQIELEIQNEELRRAQVRLETSRRKYADLYDFAPIGYFTFDKFGLILEANLTGAEMLGTDKRGLAGRPFPRFLADREQGDAFSVHLALVLQGQARQTCELRLKAKQGTRSTVRLESIAVEDEKGDLTLVRSAMSDVTERKLAEEELKVAHQELEARARDLAAANKELEAYAYTVSHDLRAPLRHIEGFVRILQEEYSGALDETGKDYLRRVSSGSQRMKDLIDALLSLSRYTRANMNRSRIYLSTMVKTAAAESKQSWPERNVELVVADGILAEGDPAMLQVVINNLVWNSWKFTQKRPDAKIEFGAFECGTQNEESGMKAQGMCKEGETVYYVRDNGAGFEKKYSGKLFTPFLRLHTEDEFPGIGIGLSIVQRIIHRHGGRIWAEGEVDKGATFYFTLG